MRRHLGGLAVFAFAWAVAAAAPALGGTITVNTTSITNDVPPDGNCDFHEALASAFSEANDDDCTGTTTAPNTIVFAQSGTYTVAGDLPDVRNELTVEGAPNVITLDGGGDHRIFRLAVSESDLTVNNLEITNGGGNFGGGGGAVLIESSQGSFTALNVDFNNNHAGSAGGGAIFGSGDITITNGFFTDNDTDGDGGAILKGGESLTLFNVLFTSNQADDSGGAIYATGLSQFEAMVITNCVFALNTADSTSSAHGGGAIYNNTTDSSVTAVVLIDNSIFVSNEATGALGGAIVNSLNARMEWIDPLLSLAGGVVKSLFIFNKAGGSGNDGLGGAIYNQGEMTIHDSTFFQNESTNSAGGAVSHNNGSNPGNLVISNTTFSDNTAGTNGGAVENHNDENVELINCTITGNNAASGGALYNELSSGIFDLSNTIVANSASGGNCGPTGTYNDVANNIQFNPNTGCGTIPTGDPALAGLTPIPPQVPGPFLVPVHPLNAGSAASSTGSAGVCNAGPIVSLDAQGAPRPQGGITCDMGAFESNRAPGYGSAPAPGAVIDVTTPPGVPLNIDIVVSETGDDNLIVNVGLAGAPELTLTSPASFTIPDGGAAQNITVQCLSPNPNLYSTTVTASHNASGSPATYTINCTVALPATPGYGSAPPPGTPLVINTNVGVPGTAIVTVSETGTATLNVTPSVLPQAEITVTGAFSIPDGGAPVDVTVTCLSNDAAGGQFITTLSIVHDGQNVPSPATHQVTCNVLPANTPGYGSAPPPGTPLVINTTVGVAATAIVTVSETGSATLTGTSAVGPEPEFQVTGGAVINIPDGDPPVDVVVQCLSANAGTFTTGLTITHNGQNVPSPATHGVTCNVAPASEPGYGSNPAPGAPLTINTTVGVGGTATVTVSETGTETLDGSSAIPVQPEFQLLAGMNFSIPDGGAPVDVVVLCLSNTPGTYTTDLTITHNGTNVPSPVTHLITCNVGAGGQAAYDSNPAPGTPLAIATAQNIPATTTVTVSETGTATLTGTVAVGPEPEFLVTTGPTFTIPDGDPPVDVIVQCLSANSGVFTTTLTITHNGSNIPSPVTHLITCTVFPPGAAGYSSIPLAPGPIGFGAAPIGGTVGTSFTILEVGFGDLVVGNPILGGMHAADFAVLTAFPITILDGGPPQTAQLECTPTGQGTRVATLTLTTNDPFQPTVLYDLTCYGPPRELIMRSDEMQDLRAAPGPLTDDDLYAIHQRPLSSYEIVVDATSGDVGASGIGFLQRVAADGVTVLQESIPTGVGFSRSLRFENNTGAPVENEYVRVRSTGCGTNCGPDDVYRIRAYETTYFFARFNNVAPLYTNLDVQNTTAHTVSGHFHFWSATGAMLGSVPFSLVAHGTLIMDLRNLPFTNGVSGSVTLSNDGAYGDLWGKTAQMTDPYGMAFDTYLERIRK